MHIVYSPLYTNLQPPHGHWSNQAPEVHGGSYNHCHGAPAGRVPFRQALDALLKGFKLAAGRAGQNNGIDKQAEDMQLAISDALLAAAKILLTADEPVR